MFSGIMTDIYANDRVVKDTVINAIAAEYLRQGITSEKLKRDINSIDAFEQNRKLTIALLALYESTSNEHGRATLIDAKYVLYKNKKMTLNEWGCKVRDGSLSGYMHGWQRKGR